MRSHEESSFLHHHPDSRLGLFSPFVKLMLPGGRGGTNQFFFWIALSLLCEYKFRRKVHLGTGNSCGGNKLRP